MKHTALIVLLLTATLVLASCGTRNDGAEPSRPESVSTDESTPAEAIDRAVPEAETTDTPPVTEPGEVEGTPEPLPPVSTPTTTQPPTTTVTPPPTTTEAPIDAATIEAANDALASAAALLDRLESDRDAIAGDLAADAAATADSD